MNDQKPIDSVEVINGNWQKHIPHTWIPRAMIFDKDLSPEALRLWLVIDQRMINKSRMKIRLSTLGRDMARNFKVEIGKKTVKCKSDGKEDQDKTRLIFERQTREFSRNAVGTWAQDLKEKGLIKVQIRQGSAVWTTVDPVFVYKKEGMLAPLPKYSTEKGSATVICESTRCQDNLAGKPVRCQDNLAPMCQDNLAPVLAPGEGNNSVRNTGAGAPALAEGQISGPEEEAPVEAPDDESCPPAAPPQRATFAQVEAAVKITLPKKGQKNDGGRGPSACAVAPAPSDRPGTDHSETALAKWLDKDWAKMFNSTYHAAGCSVMGEERPTVLAKTVKEFRNALKVEGLNHREQYHLMFEWLPKNLKAFKIPKQVNPGYLVRLLHEYLPAWKRSSRPRKPMDTSKIKVVDV